MNEKWVGRAEDGIINRAPADALLARFDTTEKADAALAELKAYWDKLLGHFSISSSEEKLDRMVNVWHQYQCMVTFNMSRSASYFESGIGRGMGFRDSCQDLLGFVHLIPDRARREYSTSQPHSLRTALLIISTSRSPKGQCRHRIRLQR